MAKHNYKSGHVHKSGTHRWKRHRPWSGSYGSVPWPWNYPPDSDDDSQGDDDGSDSQEVQTSPDGSTNGCLEDRCTSDYIAWVQQSLNRLGSSLKFTRVLDRSTIVAINQFKAKYGVPAREYYASPVLEQALLKAGASQPPPARRLPCGPTATRDLVPLLNKHRGDVPLHYLLAWITVESGGKLGDLTKICERGYFQVHPEESQDLQLDHDRLSTDAEYSVAGGIKLVKHYAAGIEKLAQQLGLPRGGDLYWGLVKLRHWIPSAPMRILLRMQKEHVPIVSWVGIRQYVASNPQLGFGAFDPRAGFKSVDRFLALAARWWLALNKTSVPATK
jgi:hypothetical protein